MVINGNSMVINGNSMVMNGDLPSGNDELTVCELEATAQSKFPENFPLKIVIQHISTIVFGRNL